MVLRILWGLGEEGTESPFLSLGGLKLTPAADWPVSPVYTFSPKLEWLVAGVCEFYLPHCPCAKGMPSEKHVSMAKKSFQSFPRGAKSHLGSVQHPHPNYLPPRQGHRELDRLCRAAEALQ